MNAGTIALNALMTLAMISGLWFGLSTFIPFWLAIKIFIPATIIMLVMMVFMGKQAAFSVFRTVAIWTWPFWIFGFARWVLAETPITALMPQHHEAMNQTINVTAPLLVSIGGWLFWRFARFQELARDVGVVLSLIVHISTIVMAFFSDFGINREIAAWAFGSLGMTLAIASTMYASPASMFMRYGSGANGVIALFLALSIVIFGQKSVEEQKAERREEKIEAATDKVHSILDAAKEKAAIAIGVVKNLRQEQKDSSQTQAQAPHAAEQIEAQAPRAAEQIEAQAPRAAEQIEAQAPRAADEIGLVGIDLRLNGFQQIKSVPEIIPNEKGVAK